MLKTVKKTKEIPVIGEYDVVVVGAGAAGCPAAICASRGGAKTLLIEKDGYLGGAAVSQLVVIILADNDKPFQGIWHEYMNRLKKFKGIIEDEVRFYKEFSHIKGSFDPEMAKYAWDDMMNEAGVDILHHAYVSDTVVAEGAINGVVVETKAGTGVITAKRVIDCTGDGAVSAFAGAQWEQGDGVNKYSMACTKVFRLGNVHKPKGFPTKEHIKHIEDGFKGAMERGEYTTPIITEGRVLVYPRNWSHPLPSYRNELMIVTSRVLKVDPLDPWQLTAAEREGREQARQLADFYKKYVPGCESSFLNDTSNHIGVRSSRRIKGIKTFTEKDAIEFKKFDDAVARGTGHVDVWPADSYTAPAVDASTKEFRKRHELLLNGEFYEIPYGCLVVEGIDNLFVAGRCISAEHKAQATLRLQHTCMSLGQAAGTAAAMSIKENVSPKKLDTKKLIAKLEKDRNEVEPAFNFYN